MPVLSNHYTSRRQMSESLVTAAFLSVSGGLQDAYTYISRGKVFANAQTGNIVLLSQHICDGDFRSVMHWRQLVLIIEILLLFLVGFLPEAWNLIANAMVSFACAMQVQAFRKVNSYAFASTMCIGNIRSGMESLCAYHKTHNRKTLFKSFHYFGVILLFALGAGLGSRFILLFGMKTIWVSCLMLLVSFSLMFIREEIDEHPELKQEEQAIQNDLHDISKEAAEIAHILENDDPK